MIFTFSQPSGGSLANENVLFGLGLGAHFSNKEFMAERWSGEMVSISSPSTAQSKTNKWIECNSDNSEQSNQQLYIDSS